MDTQDDTAERGDVWPSRLHDLLARKGYSYADVDRQYGLSAGVACLAAHGPHLKGELAIADVLGLHPCRLWPSRYDAQTGTRRKPQNYTNRPTKGPQPSENYKPQARLRHCLKGEAA